MRLYAYILNLVNSTEISHLRETKLALKPRLSAKYLPLHRLLNFFLEIDWDDSNFYFDLDWLYKVAKMTQLEDEDDVTLTWNYTCLCCV